jgi:hypothetical protein
MKEYFEEKNIKVEAIVMLNTFQADGVEFDPNDPTEIIDYKNTNDPVLVYLDDSASKIKGADHVIREKSDKKILFRHRDPIDSQSKFWHTLRKLFNNSDLQNNIQEEQ